MKKTYLIFVILFMTTVLFAQQQFTNFGSKNTITSIADKGSQVWIGTSGGLYVRSKSTGAIILNYSVNNGLPSSYINDLIIDPFDNVWVATKKGLAKFDGSSWVVYNQASGLPYNNIASVTYDLSGNIWISSSNRLLKLENDNTWTSYNSSTNANSILADSDGNIWLVSTGGGAYKFDIVSETYTQYMEFGTWNRVMDLTKDGNGILWFAGTEGLTKFDGTDWTTYMSSENLKGVTTDIYGNIWTAHSTYGISKFDPETEVRTSYTTSNSDLGNDRVLAIAIDSDNKIWAGTNYGLNRFDEANDIWNEYIVNNSISNNEVKDVKIGTDGSVWVGTSYGLNRLIDNTWTNWFSDDGLTSSYIYALSIDANNDLWIAGSLLFFFDVSENLFTSYSGGQNLKDVYAAPDGTVWLATNGGLQHFDGTNWTTYTTSDGLIDNDCRCLTSDASGNLWIGTLHGLSYWDGTSFQNYTTAEGLPYDWVQGIMVANNGDVYASTGLGGLGIFDGTTWTTITTVDGLPSNYTYETAQGPDNNIWMANSQGAVKYDGTNISYYTSNDGMADDKIYDVAISSTGEKWFGSYAGLIKSTCENPIVGFINDSTCLPGATAFTDTSLNVDATSIYEWDINNDGTVEYTTKDISHTFPSGNSYWVKLTVSNEECSSENSKVVTVFEVPTVTLNPSGNVNICQGSSTNIQIQDGYGYTYNWSTGSQDDYINVSETGVYTVTITNGTCTYEPEEVSINTLTPLNPHICMVSVDLETDKNLIVWEKPISDSIDYYNIYKEISTNNYQIIGSRNYNQTSEFVDYNSVPDVHADRYKITLVDACGNESDLSPYHQTMNLSQAQGAQSDEIVLIWNKYEDESGDFIPASYDVYRGLEQASMTLDGSTTGSLDTYNYNAESVIDNEKFIVLIDMPTCAPTGNNRASGGPYYQSSSNLEDEGIISTGVKNIASKNFSLYPNPMQNSTTIKSSEKIKSIKLYNITGELIWSTNLINTNSYKFNKNDLSKGTYIIEINNLTHQKLIIK